MRIKTEIIIGVVIIIILGLIVAGWFFGRELARLKTDIGGRDTNIENLESELRKTKVALSEANELHNYLRDCIYGIRIERDTLVEKFGVIRNAVEGYRNSVEQGADIVDESIVLIDRVIDILVYLEGIRIY